MDRNRGAVLVLVAALVSVLCGCAAPSAPAATEGAAAGGCAAAILRVQDPPASVEPGDRLALVAENLVAGCDDVREGGQPSTPTPPEDVPVEWEQASQSTELATLTTNRGTPISFEVTVPGSAQPGTATIRVQGATLEITVG